MLRSDSVGIRTQGPQLRRLLLYPTELRNHPLHHRDVPDLRVQRYCFFMKHPNFRGSKANKNLFSLLSSEIMWGEFSFLSLKSDVSTVIEGVVLLCKCFCGFEGSYVQRVFALLSRQLLFRLF